MHFRVREHQGLVRFPVRVQPRASRDAIVGVHGGALKVALTVPPVEGRANAALVQLLAKALGIPRRQLRIVAGDRSRNKTLEVMGVDGDTVRARLSG
jgi:uncharacterized protein